jgi:hypothetical protein
MPEINGKVLPTQVIENLRLVCSTSECPREKIRPKQLAEIGEKKMGCFC